MITNYLVLVSNHPKMQKDFLKLLFTFSLTKIKFLSRKMSPKKLVCEVLYALSHSDFLKLLFTFSLTKIIFLSRKMSSKKNLLLYALSYSDFLKLICFVHLLCFSKVQWWLRKWSHQNSLQKLLSAPHIHIRLCVYSEGSGWNLGIVLTSKKKLN